MLRCVDQIVAFTLHRRLKPTMLLESKQGQMIGTTVSHYRILEKLGEGGMGVVYKARDLRLDRFVCIKVLRAEQLEDESRKLRFIQEAKSASSLNHANIITVYEIDQADGADFIVMKFVAGKTLQQLIPSGGLPMADVLKYATPIASALAAANSAGIIHRHIKPGNIMAGASGIVKVLDFGLAKLTAQEDNPEDATQTLKAQTEEGTVVGTAAYMSPEQAQGKTVDARSDIFSFGAVLYEMLTGRRAFQGANRMSTLASVLQQEPKPLTEFDFRIPRELERIVVRCLRKDPDRRFQHMADLKVALEELKEESDSGKLTPAPPTARTRSWSRLALGLSAALLLLVAVAGWFWWHAKPQKTAERSLTRLTANGASVNPAISPDGKLLAYQASVGGPNPDIWVQQIGGGKAIQVTHEKDGASSPVFSPDGTQITYESHGGIYEVPALGGDPRVISGEGRAPRYTPDGSAILFGRVTEGRFRIFTAPRMGGTPVAIQSEAHFATFPIVSPDGREILTLAARDGRRERDLKRWWMISIPGGQLEEIAPPSLLPGETNAPSPLAWMMIDKNSRRQWIIFGRPNGDTYNLFRVAFTSDGRVSSDPERLTFTTGYSAGPSVSESGRMVFNSGTSLTTNLWSIPINTNRTRVTGDRQNLTQVEGVRDKSPSLSRDGAKVAFFSGRSLVVRDLVTGRETQLAQDLPSTGGGTGPTISPDGSFVAYYVSNRARTEADIYSISTAGGSPHLACHDCGSPKGFSSDGRQVLTQKGTFGDGFVQIALADVATGKVAIVLSDSQHHLYNPYYSWDDKWMGFLMQIGDDNEHYRVYVTPVANFVPAGPDRWVRLTSGEYHDDKQQFSPDGNTMYFTSNRDGFTCIWAQRLDPKTKRPLDAPFPIQHFHGSQRIYSGISRSNEMEVNVAKDKIVTNLDEFHSDIWMMELESGK
jgi:serine/threonine protein kinase/Tol biopolymer transport system component